MPQILVRDSVRPGDVLLCRSNNMGGAVADVTGNKYVHAAICTSPNKVAEASGLRVKVVEIENLFEAYDHIAVLRQPNCWSPSRVVKLQRFIETAISNKAKFNSFGIRNFEEQKKIHEENLTNNLNAFFEGINAGPPSARESYFCSELVAAAHVAVGIIEPSAAVVYDPEVQSPGELANDFTFGIFAGYLIPYPEYQIPKDDEFHQTTTVNEIFKTKT